MGRRSRSTNFDVNYLGFLTYDSILTSSIDFGVLYMLVDFQTVLTTVVFFEFNYFARLLGQGVEIEFFGLRRKSP